MKHWKRFGALLCVGLLLLGLTACGQTKQTLAEDANDGKLHIVTTIFPAYDFSRAAGGEFAEVTLLLPPGAETHSYEPTPVDILAVQDCDLFVYLGGESDTWVDTILDAVQPKGTVLRMMDCADHLLDEETVEGMQAEPGHDHDDDDDHDDLHLGEVRDIDEHVWTSPKNAAAITRAIGDTLGTIDPAHQAAYQENAAAYAGQIDALDASFADFFASAPNRPLLFGDRFPLRYFAEEYGLTYYAAFPGCSTQTEPSAATVAFLIQEVETAQIPTVWYIEFSNHLVADSIAEATGTETAMFHSCHNVSQADLDAGATYVSLMQQNLEQLKLHF